MRTVALGELADIVSGATPKTDVPKYWDGEIPWITPADLSAHEGIYFRGKPKTITRAGLESSSATMLPPGSILFSSRAPIGHCALTTYPLCTNQGFKNIVPNGLLDPLYGFFALKFVTPRIIAKGRGATFAEVTKEIMEKVEVPYCDPPEQKRIGGKLQQADRLRRTRRYALELSDSFLPAAFLQLFGDMGENEKRYPAVHLAELFAKDREGTKCGPFGSALKKEEYVESGVPVWTMENIGESGFREHGCLYITDDKYRELAAYSIQSGDILISRAGTVGRMAIVRSEQPRSIIHTNLIRLSLNAERVLPVFFVVLMSWFGHKIARLKRGQEDAYTFMSTGSLGGLRIPVPPMAMQQRFAAISAHHERLRAGQQEAFRQANHLFHSLLDHAFAPAR